MCVFGKRPPVLGVSVCCGVEETWLCWLLPSASLSRPSFVLFCGACASPPPDVLLMLREEVDGSSETPQRQPEVAQFEISDLTMLE